MFPFDTLGSACIFGCIKSDGEGYHFFGIKFRTAVNGNAVVIIDMVFQ